MRMESQGAPTFQQVRMPMVLYFMICDYLVRSAVLKRAKRLAHIDIQGITVYQCLGAKLFEQSRRLGHCARYDQWMSGVESIAGDWAQGLVMCGESPGLKATTGLKKAVEQCEKR